MVYNTRSTIIATMPCRSLKQTNRQTNSFITNLTARFRENTETHERLKNTPFCVCGIQRENVLTSVHSNKHINAIEKISLSSGNGNPKQ